MKKIFALIIVSALLLAGCDGKKIENNEIDTPVESPDGETVDVVTPEVPEESPEILIEEKDESPEKEPEEIPAREPEKVHVGVTGISLTTYSVSLYPGESKMPIVTMSPAGATDLGEIWESSDTTIATVNKYGNITGVSVGECVVTVTSKDNPDVSATVSVKVQSDAEITYIDGILIANKTYPLPRNYNPGNNKEAEHQLALMFAAAREDGIHLKTLCGFRSYLDQTIIYNGYVARDGKDAADRYSARPGHSEHQSGLAFDLNSLSWDFGETPEGKWLAENCHKFGFIIRYPKDKEHITGYMYEPWHVRYLGVDKAKEVYESGLCLEEFLGITSQYQ